MEERKQDLKTFRKSPFEDFEGKAVLIITNSGFNYHTDKLEVFENHIRFLDKYNCSFFLVNSEVKIIQEIKNGY